MRRETRQLSLAEALVSGGKSGERLARIFAVLDWPALEAVLGDLRAAPTGRPGYPPLVMLRVLLLAQWYGLSDPRARGGAGRPPQLPPVRRPAARRPGAGRDHDLPLP